jgi:hypothetical protein
MSGVWRAQIPGVDLPDHLDLWFGVNAGWASDGLYRRRIPLLKR